MNNLKTALLAEISYRIESTGARLTCRQTRSRKAKFADDTKVSKLGKLLNPVANRGLHMKEYHIT